MKINKTLGNIVNYHGLESSIYSIEWIRLKATNLKNRLFINIETFAGHRLEINLMEYTNLQAGDILGIKDFSILVIDLDYAS